MITRSLACIMVLGLLAAEAPAALILDLKAVGPGSATSPSTPTVSILGKNSDFGLGGLRYRVSFLCSVAALTSPVISDRDYGSFGWVANDGLFDNSSPAEGSAAASFGNLILDTAVAPAGSERPAGADAVVEQFTINIPAGIPNGTVLTIALDQISASNGNGDDFITSMGGRITTGDLSITIVPEPALLSVAGLLGGVLLRRRR